jgi:hypothetical protein
MGLTVSYLMNEDEIALVRNMEKNPSLGDQPQLGDDVMLHMYGARGKKIEVPGIVAGVYACYAGVRYSIAYEIAGSGIYAVIPHYAGNITKIQPSKEEVKDGETESPPEPNDPGSKGRKSGHLQRVV